jgi:hypothetical protein
MNYLDVEQKFQYYKEYILKQFIQKGIYPDNSLIASHLDSIDLNLSLFKNYNKTTGEKFNPAEYNEVLKLIYKDITILYNILNTLAIKEFNDLQNYINSYITELNSVVETYEAKAAYENNSTTLGETLLFQNSNFTISNDNSVTIVDLSSVDFEAASEIACIANVNNVDLKNVVFSFTGDDGELTVSPYNSENTLLTVPGDKTITTYDYELSDSQTTTGSILMNTSINPSIKNNYTILGGKDMMIINKAEDNSYSVQSVPNSSGTLVFNEKSYINFYVVGGKNITFNFNKKPISTNFPIDESTITGLDDIHHFQLEVDEDFCLEIQLDSGNIYAIKEDGIINNNKLYYTGLDIVNNFHIIEEAPGKTVTYKAKLKIYNDNDNNTEIDNIVIKKLS